MNEGEDYFHLLLPKLIQIQNISKINNKNMCHIGQS